MSVAIVGSSGGGGATLGHTNPVELLTTIHKELGRIQYRNQERKYSYGLRHALFVSLQEGGKGMDSANPATDKATLYAVGCEKIDLISVSSFKSVGDEVKKQFPFRVREVLTGTLCEVNDKCKELEEKFLVPSILAAKDPSENISAIQGLICISCDPHSVNSASLAAAAALGIPVTGSGGTSLASAATLYEGLNLVGNAGGSVATTTYTRALSYCHALASAWGEQYSPFFKSENVHNDKDYDGLKPHIRSILSTCLPSFIAVCLACHLLTATKNMSLSSDMTVFGFQFSLNENDTDWLDRLIYQLRMQALPSVCAIVTATTYAPQHGSTAVMAAGVASMACSGSILSGLLTGWLVSYMLGWVLFGCIGLRIPATMTNILVAGCVGTCVAILTGASGIVTALRWTTHSIREIIQAPSPSFGTWDGSGLGFLFGCIFCYGSKVGWYHRIFLPLILIEMEHGEASFWGSVDECTLVMVSAGICAANLLLPIDNKTNAAISRRGLLINILCGDFIEVAYPFMEESFVVNMTGYFASGLATEILYKAPRYVLSSAYIPVVLSILITNDWTRMSLAVTSAFCCSFIGTIIGNIIKKITWGNKESEGIKDE